MTKFVDEDGSQKWTCDCGEIRKGWNTTKALGHMIGRHVLAASSHEKSTLRRLAASKAGKL